MTDYVILYLIIYASVLLHETAHFLAAKCFHIPVLEVKIGADWPKLRLGIWKISPLLGISFVSAESEQIMKLTDRRKTVYFSAGICTNLMLAAVCAVIWLITSRFLWLPAACINLFSAVGNAIPVGSTDIGTLRKLRAHD